MTTHKMIPALVFFLTATSALPALAAKDDLIGYVDIRRAMAEVEDGKRAKKELETTFNSKQTALRKQEAELEAMKKRLEGPSVDQDDPAVREQILEFQRKFNALRQRLVKEQQEFETLQSKAFSEITTKLQAIIKTIGKSQGYTMIMEVQGSSLLFAKPHLDLTNEVIRRYNQGEKSGSKRRRGRKRKK